MAYIPELQALIDAPAGAAPPSAGAPPSPSSPATSSPVGSPAGAPATATPASSTPTEQRSGGDAFTSGVGDALSFGFLDELGAGVNSLLPGERENVWSSDRSFGDVFAGNVAANRAILKGDAEQHKVANLAGQVAGSVLIPFGAGAKGALQVAKVGAVQGAIYGAGSGEGLADRGEEAVKGGIIGGVAGAALGKAVEVGGRVLSRIRGKGSVAEEVAAADPTTSLTEDGRLRVDITPEENQPVAGYTEDGRPVLKAQETPDELVPLAPERTDSAPPQDGAVGGGDGESPPGGTTDLAVSGANPNAINRAGLADLSSEVAALRARMRGPEGPRAADVPASSPTGAFRVGNLFQGGVEDTGATLSRLAATVAGDADTAAGAAGFGVAEKVVRSDADLMRAAGIAASDMGEDAEAVLAAAQNLAGKFGDLDTMMATLRTVWSRAGEEVNQYHLADVNWETATDELVESAAQTIRQLSNLSYFVQQAKAGLGRGLRVNSLPDSDTWLKAVQEGTPLTVPTPRSGPGATPTTRQGIKDWLDLWGMTEGSPSKRSQFLQDLLTIPLPGKYLRTSFANNFTASILSAPRTVALNIIGPGFISLVRNGERMLGAIDAATDPFISKAARAEAMEVARQTPIAYLRTLGDIKDVFRMALQSAERNHTIIGGGGQTGDALTTYGSITRGLGQAANIEQSTGRLYGWTANLLDSVGGGNLVGPDMPYTLGNLINVWPKAFARVNNGLDEFAKRLAYQGEIRVRAQVEAAQMGLEGQAFADHVAGKLRGAYDEVGHAADEEMLRSAERTTLTGTPGVEDGWTRRFALGIQGLRRDVPEVRYILPVFNVPANALGETLRRLPIARLAGTKLDKYGMGGLMAHLFEDTAADLAGERGPVAQAEAHGRTMLGASFLMAGILMNRQGHLTGAGPSEPTDRKVWLQTHQPYSIRVGDSWVRYDKFDILGGLLSIPATVADVTTYRAADQGVGDVIASGAGALAQWFKDRAALRNAAGLLALGDNPTQNASRLFTSTTAGVAAGFYPAALRTLGTDTTDPYQRMRSEWTDYLKSALPGLSNTLEPVRNVLGEPMNRSADTFSEAVFPVTMASAVSWKTDQVLDELDRLYQTTGYGAGADPHSLGYGFFDPRAVKMEDGRSILDHAMAARQVLKLEGRTLRESLQGVIDSEEYAAGVDADSGSKETSLGDASRGYMVRRVFDRYNKAVKATLAQSSPIALSYLTAAAAKQRDDAYLKGISAEDLANDPSLYAVHGINSAAYADKIKSSGEGSVELLEALGL